MLSIINTVALVVIALCAIVGALSVFGVFGIIVNTKKQADTELAAAKQSREAALAELRRSFEATSSAIHDTIKRESSRGACPNCRTALTRESVACPSCGLAVLQ